MAEADLERLFPTLRADGYRKTSDEDSRYDCVAWANGETRLWWDHFSGPGRYWPRQVPRSYMVDAYAALFRGQGYEDATTGDVEAGYEKVAIFMSAERRFTHVAKQLPNGEWQSKLGELEDIEHRTLASLHPAYGSIFGYMRRRLSSM